MPITQDRMMNLISAAREYKDSRAALILQITDLATRIINGEFPTSELLSRLPHIASDTSPGEFAIETLCNEAAHYKHLASRNRIAAARATRKRRDANIPMRSDSHEFDKFTTEGRPPPAASHTPKSPDSPKPPLTNAAFAAARAELAAADQVERETAYAAARARLKQPLASRPDPDLISSSTLPDPDAIPEEGIPTDEDAL